MTQLYRIGYCSPCPIRVGQRRYGIWNLRHNDLGWFPRLYAASRCQRRPCEVETSQGFFVANPAPRWRCVRKFDSLESARAACARHDGTAYNFHPSKIPHAASLDRTVNSCRHWSPRMPVARRIPKWKPVPWQRWMRCSGCPLGRTWTVGDGQPRSTPFPRPNGAGFCFRAPRIRLHR